MSFTIVGRKGTDFCDPRIETGGKHKQLSWARALSTFVEVITSNYGRSQLSVTLLNRNVLDTCHRSIESRGREKDTSGECRRKPMPHNQKRMGTTHVEEK
jgi:hypothetical protein